MFRDFMLLCFDFYVLIPHSSIRQRGAGRPVESLQLRADEPMGLKGRQMCALSSSGWTTAGWTLPKVTQRVMESLQNISSPVPLQTSPDPCWKGHLADDFTLLTQWSQICFPWIPPYVALKHLWQHSIYRALLLFLYQWSSHKLILWPKTNKWLLRKIILCKVIPKLAATGQQHDKISVI